MMPFQPPARPESTTHDAAPSSAAPAGPSQSSSFQQVPKRPLWHLSFALGSVFAVLAIILHLLAGPDGHHSGSEGVFIAELIGGLSLLAALAAFFISLLTALLGRAGRSGRK
jgi:hypothetical protein